VQAPVGILRCLKCFHEPMRTSMLRSTNSIAFFDASRPRGLITTLALESSEPKSHKSGSSAALANG